MIGTELDEGMRRDILRERKQNENTFLRRRNTTQYKAHPLESDPAAVVDELCQAQETAWRGLGGLRNPPVAYYSLLV